jgi:hypothetical protein
VYPLNHRGPPPASGDARRTALLVAGAGNADRAEDGDWPADARTDQPFPPHLRAPSPQLLPASDRAFRNAPSSFSTKQASSRLPAQHQAIADPDADASADPAPAKKAWEIEVERLRLAMQQQQVSGASASSSELYLPPTPNFSLHVQLLYPGLQPSSATEMLALILLLERPQCRAPPLPPQRKGKRYLVNSLRSRRFKVHVIPKSNPKIARN